MENDKHSRFVGRLALFFVLLLVCLENEILAQDPQFSQFYAAPLYLNPAFAGSTGQNRVGLNYRNQWPSIDANFTTVSAYADFYLEDYNSGVGVLINSDREGLLGLQSISVAFQYSYDLQLTKKLSFRPGFQAAVYNRSLNFSKLTFGDQFDAATGEVVNPTSVDGLSTGQSVFFPDISFGGMLFTKNYWVGGTVSHITQPNQSLVGENSPLPQKISAHAGYKFFLKPGTMKTNNYSVRQERSIAPTAQYRQQGLWSQMDVGMYVTLEPIILGTWYRGIPFKTVNGISNNESIVMLVGITKRGKTDVLNIGYSYDYTLSQLGSASGGAHEISIVYSWSTRDPRKPPKDKLRIPCPEF